MTDVTFFNISGGFVESVTRGLKSGILTSEQYRRLHLAETLEDIRTVLEETDYGAFELDEGKTIKETISLNCKRRLAVEYNYLRSLVSGDTGALFDIFRAESMIENVILILQTAINGRNMGEVLDILDPLGYFDEMKIIPALDITAPRFLEDLYEIILHDTPVGKYVREYLSLVDKNGSTVPAQCLNETDTEILKQVMRRAWLEDMAGFVEKLGFYNTRECLGAVFMMEADHMSLSVTLNLLNIEEITGISQTNRHSLYPSFGFLHPGGTTKLCNARNAQQVKSALEGFPRYMHIIEACATFYSKDTISRDINDVNEIAPAVHLRKRVRCRSIEDLIYHEAVEAYEYLFCEQYHYGVVYAWLKLRQQEIKNIEWIMNMVVLGKREYVEDVVIPFQEPNK